MRNQTVVTFDLDCKSLKALTNVGSNGVTVLVIFKDFMHFLFPDFFLRLLISERLILMSIKILHRVLTPLTLHNMTNYNNDNINTGIIMFRYNS